MGKEDAIHIKITGAQEHDCVSAPEAIIELKSLPIKYFVADRGYDDDKIRRALKAQSITPVIPPRKNRIDQLYYDKTMYKWRWRVEALFGKIKENRRLSMRYDKLDSSFLGFVTLALIKPLVC
jgi:transposase